jgi:hypothetical protein
MSAGITANGENGGRDRAVMEGSRRHRRPGLLAAGALISVMALSGCMLHRHAKAVPQRADPVAIEIENQDFYDADVYALVGGVRLRLGMVTGETNGTFHFPWTPREIRMEVHLIGAGSYVTEPIYADPGDQLQLILQPDLHQLIR